MQIEEAEKFLKKNGIQHPILEVLDPSINDYDVLLIQPKGDIEASKTRVGNRDRAGSVKQCVSFLLEAAKRQTALVVAPEYCVPWEALRQAVLAGHAPGAKSLWVLGCESITLNELDVLENSFNGKVRVLFEDLDRAEAGKKGFLDPLSYLFHTKDAKDNDCLVLLVQFKTRVSIDEERIEGDHLYCGSSVYVFGTCGKTIRLLSLICSDAFAADASNLKDVYDRTLLLHIQLNPNPRHSAFRSYRKYLFETAADVTEIICLNWASHVKEWKEGVAQPKDWKNIGGTAWYLRPDKFNHSDKRVKSNHVAGLYYTRLKPMKWHVLFFNYDPAVFVLKTSKVWHHGFPMAQQNRSGPRLEEVIRWHEATGKWIPELKSADGFETLVYPYGTTVDPLKQLYATSPIDVERLLALTAGYISQPTDWYSVIELDSFAIEESEYIKRITFAQDPEQLAAEFRDARVRKFVTCRGIQHQFTDWPPELSDLANGYEFHWNAEQPHSNVVTNAGRQATIVYLGEERLDSDLMSVGNKLRTALLRLDQPNERVGIFHRRNGQLQLWQHPDSKRYDKPKGTSPSDITEAGS